MKNILMPIASCMCLAVFFGMLFILIIDIGKERPSYIVDLSFIYIWVIMYSLCAIPAFFLGLMINKK